MNAPEDFRSFAAQFGYELPQDIQPGRRIRFSTNGKTGDSAGWAILFQDCEGGVVGDWRTGTREVWQARRDRPFSPEERRAFLDRIEREQKEIQEQRDRDAAKAALEAKAIWDASKPAREHPYLAKKGIGAYGLRLYRGPLVIRDMACDGSLILPLRNATGEIRSIEFIAADGEKRFLPDGDYKGSSYHLGSVKDRAAVVEGFATGASIYKATGIPVRIAATSGNLAAVAASLRAAHPDAELIVCADNDKRTVCQRHKAEGLTEAVSPLSERPEWCRCNPGMTFGLAAARNVGGKVVFPVVANGTDFNDLAKESGDSEVKKQIESAPPVQQKEEADMQPAVIKAQGPEPLPELPEVPDFDYELLPSVLRAYVRDISERMQCPPEFAAVSTLVMAGAAIGRRLGVRPKREDTWTVIPNLWGMLVGRSGFMKSPALKEAIKPLKKMQAKAFEEHEERLKEFALAERADKLRMAQSEKEAVKLLAQNPRADILSTLRQDAVLVRPVAKRFVANDTTPEKLIDIMKENPGGVLMERDELIGLLRSMEKDGNQEARSIYLSAADGDAEHTVDRMARGTGHVQGLCVSIIGGIQPGVLAGYVRETQRSGSGDDGLLQRFSLAVYPDANTQWRNVDRSPDGEARAAVAAMIERLCTLTPEAAGAQLDPYSGLAFVRFDSDAYGLFIKWLGSLEGRLRFGDDHPSIVSHLAKYRKLVPTLALINHMAEGGVGDVPCEALSRALLLCNFLEAHARRIYSYASRPDVDAAKTVIAKLKSGALPVEFTARDCYRHGWSGLTTAEEAHAAIKLLIDFKYVTEKPIPPHETGRPTRVYIADPSIKGGK